MSYSFIAVVLSCLIGYVIGCSNMALYLSKLKGVDLRQIGSKNLGTCNSMLGLGIGSAALVFLHDAGKAVLAVCLCRHLFPGIPVAGYAAGAAAVIGHIFPFYLNFRGGKGFAAYLGMIFILDRRFALIALVAVALLTLITNYIVYGTAVTVISYPVFTALATHSIAAAVTVCAASAVVLFRHRENFARIADGTEIGLLHRARK